MSRCRCSPTSGRYGSAAASPADLPGCAGQRSPLRQGHIGSGRQGPSRRRRARVPCCRPPRRRGCTSRRAVHGRASSRGGTLHGRQPSRSRPWCLSRRRGVHRQRIAAHTRIRPQESSSRRTGRAAGRSSCRSFHLTLLRDGQTARACICGARRGRIVASTTYPIARAPSARAHPREHQARPAAQARRSREHLQRAFDSGTQRCPEVADSEAGACRACRGTCVRPAALTGCCMDRQAPPPAADPRPPGECRDGTAGARRQVAACEDAAGQRRVALDVRRNAE